MPQVINELPGLGALLGSGLGKGLSGTLDQLTQFKMNQLAQRQQSGAYQNLGLPQYLAEALSQVSPQERFDIFQRLQPEDFNRQMQQQGVQGMQQALAPQQAQQNPLMQAAQQVSQENKQSTPLLARPSAAQKAAEVKAQRAEQAAVDKRTQKFYDETLDKSESAKSSNLRLEKMEKLIEKGKLPISTLYNVLKNLEELSTSHGLVSQALGGLISPIATVLRGVQRRTSPDTEEFEKLSADFIKEAKPIFGARITDTDLRAFMQTIPTLSQSDQGKRKIINNIKILNEGSIVKAKALKDIIKENGGKRPDNIRELVEEKSKQELDKIAKKFVD